MQLTVIAIIVLFQVFDAGRVFQLLQVEDEDGDRSWMATVGQDHSVSTEEKQQYVNT